MADYPDELNILTSTLVWPPKTDGLPMTPQSAETPYLWALDNQGAFEAQASVDGSRLTIPVYVRWDGWGKAIRNFLGYSMLKQQNPFAWVSRRLPLPFPDWKRLLLSVDPLETDVESATPWMYAVSCSRVEGCGPRGHMDDTRTPRYAVAKLHLTFTGLPFGILPDDSNLVHSDAVGDNPDEATFTRYVSGPYFKPFQRQVTIRRGLMKAVPGDNDPLGVGDNILTEGIGIPEAGSEVTYIWHQVPEAAFPFRAITACMGRVNQEAFDIFEAGTLLFEQPDATRHESAVGANIYDIQYRFKYMPRPLRGDPNLDGDDPDAGTPQGWNSFLTFVQDPGDVFDIPFYDYRLFTLDGRVTGDPAFRGADFKILFRPDQPPPP